MKKHNSAYYATVLAEGLSEKELPFEHRSDGWWDMFWHYIGLNEAQRLKGKV